MLGGVLGGAGLGLFGEGIFDEAVEFLDRIGRLVFQQRPDGLVDRPPIFRGWRICSGPTLFPAAPFWCGCGRVLAFDGRQVFVLHFQHDVDLFVLQLFVESQESLQLDRIGVGAGPFSWCLLGVMDFLLAVRFFPSLFGFGDPVWSFPPEGGGLMAWCRLS